MLCLYSGGEESTRSTHRHTGYSCAGQMTACRSHFSPVGYRDQMQVVSFFIPWAFSLALHSDSDLEISCFFFFFNCLAKIFLNHYGVPSVPPSKKIQGRTLVICSSIYLSTGIVASLWLLFTFKRCQFLDIFPDKALCLRVLYTQKYIFYSENLEYSKHNKNKLFLFDFFRQC